MARSSATSGAILSKSEPTNRVRARRHGFWSNRDGPGSLSSRSPISPPNCAPSGMRRSLRLRVPCRKMPAANWRSMLRDRYRLSIVSAWRRRPPEKIINVPVRTLDSILTEAGSPTDLISCSIDVEGHEIEVLRGFDIARWRPRLILLEDHVADLSKHRYLSRPAIALSGVMRTTVGMYRARSAAKSRVDRSLGDFAQILSCLAVPHVAQSFAPFAKTGQLLRSRLSGPLAGGCQSCVCSYLLA